MNKTLLTIVVVILLALYVTNPTKAEFQEFAKEYVKKEVVTSCITSNSFLGSLVSAFTDKAVDKAVDIFVTRKDYIFFSTYKVQATGLKYEFLGIFKKFLPITDIINASKINIDFKDPRAIIDEKIELKEDFYIARKILVEKPSEITVKTELVSGPPIETYFVDENCFESWKAMTAGNKSIKIQYYPDLSQNDGTDYGGTMPPMNFQDDISTINAKVLVKELN